MDAREEATEVVKQDVVIKEAAELHMVEYTDDEGGTTGELDDINETEVDDEDDDEDGDDDDKEDVDKGADTAGVVVHVTGIVGAIADPNAPLNQAALV